MDNEAQILEPLKQFVQQNGNFALLLSYPNGLVKFHSSDSFKHYIDLFTQGGNATSGTEDSQSPLSSNSTSANTSFDHTSPVTNDENLVQLSRALESPTFELRLSSHREVVNHLRACFRELQQLYCKTVAKAWIKVIEPKKQTNYPYNKGEDSKPHWWPSHIRHCEPDHLIKSERIDLMTSIVMSANTNVKSLRDATNRISSLEQNKMRVLDEIYMVVHARKFENNDRILVVSDFENGNRSSKKGSKPKSRTPRSIFKNHQKFDLSDQEEEDNGDTTMDEAGSSKDSKQTDITNDSNTIHDPNSLSLLAPQHYHDGFLTSSPNNHPFKEMVNTTNTPQSMQSNDDPHALDRHFPSYSLQFSPTRVDPEMLEQESNEQMDDDRIISEVLKIRDYNIKHSEKGVKKKSVSKKKKVGKLGPPLYYMKTTGHGYEKVPVFKDEDDAE